MGVCDILLALFPFFVVRKLQLQTREKVGLTIAMSLGAITGVFVVIRVFLQVVQGDFNFGKPSPYPYLRNLTEKGLTCTWQTS
jgi:hypothetical protein